MICLQHQFKSKRLPHLEQVQKGSPPSGQFPFITLPCSCTAFSQAFTVNWFWWRISDERQSSLDNNRLRMRLDFVNFYMLQLQETEGAHYVRYYNHAISLPEFSSNTIRTDRWLFLRCSEDEKQLSEFPSFSNVFAVWCVRELRLSLA